MTARSRAETPCCAGSSRQIADDRLELVRISEGLQGSSGIRPDSPRRVLRGRAPSLSEQSVAIQMSAPIDCVSWRDGSLAKGRQSGSLSHGSSRGSTEFEPCTVSPRRLVTFSGSSHSARLFWNLEKCNCAVARASNRIWPRVRMKAPPLHAPGRLDATFCTARSIWAHRAWAMPNLMHFVD